MKLINPILITLNNTLHIKADNLDKEIEVDSSCVDKLIDDVWLEKRKTRLLNEIPNAINLMEGINISELSDRIELREERILLAKSGGYREGLMIEPATFIDGKPYKVTYKAFLLLVKEDNFPNIASALRKGINPMYTIEEIEKAIDEAIETWEHKHIKNIIINNLKK